MSEMTELLRLVRTVNGTPRRFLQTAYLPKNDGNGRVDWYLQSTEHLGDFYNFFIHRRVSELAELLRLVLTVNGDVMSSSSIYTMV